MMIATEPKRKGIKLPNAADEAARLHERRRREMKDSLEKGFARLRVADPGEDDQPDANFRLRGPSPRMNLGGFGMPADLRASLQILSTDLSSIYPHLKQMEGKELARNELKAFVDETIKSLGDEPAQKESHELYQAAWEAKRSGDNKKMVALCELRKEAINNFIRARGHFLEIFFEETVLGQNDSAYIYNETMYAQAVYYMAQDGKLNMQRAIAARTNYLIPLYYVSSQKYGYQIEDLQRGNITAPALATADQAFDIAAQLDWNAYLLMTGQLPRASQNGGMNGVFGNFVTALTNPTLSGAPYPPQLWTYNAHPRVQASLLPTTNVLYPYNDPIPSGLSQGRLAGMLVNASNAPIVGFNVAHAVEQYCNQWGNSMMDGPLRPTGLLLVPAIDAASGLGQITVTGAKPTALAEGLLSNYTRFEYGSITYTILPDVTIPRGTLFAPLNKPVGRNFVKPSFDREFVNTDFEANWEDRWYRKTQGLYVPVQWAPRAVEVVYQ
jgi:hypothetical protein